MNQHRRVRRTWFAIGCCIVLVSVRAQAAETTITEAFINAPVAEIWRLLTTAEGYAFRGAARAEVDFKLGGEIRTEEAADGQLGDADTMVEEILSYEPEHMLSTRIKQLPQRLQLSSAASGWSVIYLTPLGATMTQLKRIDLAPDASASELPSEVQRFLTQQNRAFFNRLERHYAPKCKLCQKEAG